MTNRSIAGLDYIRFFAAFGVMIFHLCYWIWAPIHVTTKELVGNFFYFPAFEPIGHWGWVGVQIFFVVSGFVIAYSANGKTPLAFLKSRILRLAPAVWICASLTALLILTLAPFPPADIGRRWISSVAFVPVKPWIDVVYWTLGVEIAFYIVIFFLLCIDRFRWLDRLAIVLATGSTLFWIAHFSNLIPYPLEAICLSRAGRLLLIQHGCEFALGIMLWRYAGSRPPAHMILPMMIAIAGGVMEIYHIASRDALNVPDQQVRWVTPILIWLGSIIAIVISVRIPRKQQASTRADRIAREIGLATYPLYLIHNVCGVLVMYALASLGIPHLLSLGLAIAIVLVATGVIIGLERKLRNLITTPLDRLLAIPGRRLPFLVRSTHRIG